MLCSPLQSWIISTEWRMMQKNHSFTIIYVFIQKNHYWVEKKIRLSSYFMQKIIDLQSFTFFIDTKWSLLSGKENQVLCLFYTKNPLMNKWQNLFNLDSDGRNQFIYFFRHCCRAIQKKKEIKLDNFQLGFRFFPSRAYTVHYMD